MRKKTLNWTDRNLNDGHLYQKVGKRYHPVSDLSALDGLQNGAWLIVVEKGCTSIKRCVEPDNAAVEAAFKITQEKLVNVISKACEARPKSTLLTPLERKAIKAYYKVMGNEKILMFQYQNMYDMAQEILTAVSKK